MKSPLDFMMQAVEVYACIPHGFQWKKPCGQTLFDACALESVRFQIPLLQGFVEK